jgi:uncharacterized protein YndB with AHSA1/START domain
MRSFFLAAVVVTAAVAAERLMTPHPASAAIAASADASEKMLRVEITVPAPRAEVWKAFATSEGLSTWLAPNSNVELEPGGEWMVHFPGGSTGGGNIVSFVPEKEIVISALAAMAADAGWGVMSRSAATAAVTTTAARKNERI